MAKKPVTWRQREQIPVIEVRGDFSDAIEEELVTVYREACQLNPQHIILKLDPRGHIYSTGMAVLVSELISKAEQLGQKFHVVELSEHFREVFELTGLTRYVGLFPSEQVAIESLKG